MSTMAQSAIEYLITYGWMILVTAVILAALFGMGIFSPGEFGGEMCILPGGLSCISYQMAHNGMLTLNLQQVTQSPINITAIGCTSNTTFISMNAFQPNIYMPIGSNYTFSVTCYTQNGIPFSGTVGSIFSGSLILNYTDTLSGLPHTVFGRLVAKVSS